MFSKATANFVRQIDPDGSLIHVSRINDSQKLVPMALVVKRNRIWFWQKPKYQPTVFTLSDLLQGDKELTLGVSETEFLTYRGTFGDALSGRLDTEAGSLGLTVEGRGSSTLQSCFGKLKKEELDVKTLLHDSRDRHVNMQHKLVEQLQKGVELLAVVRERILTTSSCSVTQTRKEQCTLQGILSLLGRLGSSVQVCVKETNNIESDSDVSLEIPSGTVIAYSILELEIKKDGHYNICLQPGRRGGIEADPVHLWGSQESLDMVDGLQAIDNLSPLAELPQSTRHSLFKGLQETLRHRIVLSHLQSILEELCGGETLHMAEPEELSESQRKLVTAVLDTSGTGCPTKDGQCDVPANLNALHLLVSALEELADETLRLLSEISPDFLEAFDTLLSRLNESRKPISPEHLPVQLQDNQALQMAEQLLSSTSFTLRGDTDRQTETEDKDEIPLMVLCLSVRGLFLLSEGPKQQ